MTQEANNPKSAAQGIEGVERPQIRWKVILQIAAGFAIVWLTSFMVVPYVGYWGVGISAVLTLVALGFGFYIWRLTRKSAAIVDILKGATDEEGRRSALQKLSSKAESNDALAALAQAQLLARDQPAEAMTVLEGIDLKKAPAMIQDDVRANLGLLYLAHNRVRDARELADLIRLDRQPQPKAKAMYASVIAESFARTGKAEEAQKLLETYRPEDEAYGEVRPLLLRAEIFTHLATKKRNLAKRSLERLAGIEPMMVASFTQRGTPIELQNFARQLLAKRGMIPKQRMRVRMH